MIVDYSLPELYTIINWMKINYNYTMDELLNIIPVEFEIFYHMCINDFKMKQNPN